MAVADQGTNKTVVVAVDAGNDAKFALDFYMKQLSRPDDEVILLHVSSGPLPDDFDSTNLWEQTMETDQAAVEELERDMVQRVKRYKLEPVFNLQTGRAGEKIVSVAQELDASYVVIGSRSRNVLARTLLGSVSDYVLHNAPCPVLICNRLATKS